LSPIPRRFNHSLTLLIIAFVLAFGPLLEMRPPILIDNLHKK
jgi:hypothetical protein